MVFMEDNKVGVEDGVVSQRIKFRSTFTQEKEAQVVGGPSAAVSTHEVEANMNNTTINEKKKTCSSIQNINSVPENQPR